MNYWTHSKPSLQRMKQALAWQAWQKCRLIQVLLTLCCRKQYSVAMKHFDWVKDEINKLLTAKVICSSHSSWSAPIIVVLKGNGDKSLVIDYPALNKVMRKLIWPMPKVRTYSQSWTVQDTSLLWDLSAGYHHILLDDASIPKTAFTSPSRKY